MTLAVVGLVACSGDSESHCFAGEAEGCPDASELDAAIDSGPGAMTMDASRDPIPSGKPDASSAQDAASMDGAALDGASSPDAAGDPLDGGRDSGHVDPHEGNDAGDANVSDAGDASTSDAGDASTMDAGADASTDDAGPDPDDDGGADPDTLDICGTEVDIGDYTDPGSEYIIDSTTFASNPQLNPLGALVLAAYIGTLDANALPWIERDACAGSACEISPGAYQAGLYSGGEVAQSLLFALSYSIGPDGTGINGLAAISNEDAFDVANDINAVINRDPVSFVAAIMANDRINAQLDAMDYWQEEAIAWSLDPEWSPLGGGYYLDDSVGEQVIEHGITLGKPIFFVNKGLPLNGSNATYSNPRDIGPTAVAYPAARLIVRHAAFEHGFAAGTNSRPNGNTDYGWGPGVGNWPEGPYDELDTDVQALYPLTRGVNSLIQSLRANDIGPNENVYVALDAVWGELITRPTEAAHVLGKLLLYVGQDNILWATNSMFYGKPAPMIAAFRSFQIPSQLRAQYGYPELTPEIKAKIFGLNAARLFCLPPPQ